MTSVTTEDRSLTETIEHALVVRGYGPKSAKDAAGIAAAAVAFHSEQHDPLLRAAPDDDGISQGVSRLTLLAVLADDRDQIARQVDDERVSVSVHGDTISFPYRGHRVLVEYETKTHTLGSSFARVRLLHSLPISAARYATWSVMVGSDNMAIAVPIVRDIDLIIDAERAEVFA